MSALLATAFALFAGLMMTRLFKVMHLKLPDVTAFLIAGVLVGPFVIERAHKLADQVSVAAVHQADVHAAHSVSDHIRHFC